jgi:hypothetical protein
MPTPTPAAAGGPDTPRPARLDAGAAVASAPAPLPAGGQEEQGGGSHGGSGGGSGGSGGGGGGSGGSGGTAAKTAGRQSPHHKGTGLSRLKGSPEASSSGSVLASRGGATKDGGGGGAGAGAPIAREFRGTFRRIGGGKKPLLLVPPLNFAMVATGVSGGFC